MCISLLQFVSRVGGWGLAIMQCKICSAQLGFQNLEIAPQSSGLSDFVEAVTARVLCLVEAAIVGVGVVALLIHVVL